MIRNLPVYQYALTKNSKKNALSGSLKNRLAQ